MSKEQTPITARVEWLSKRIDLGAIRPIAKELIAFQIKEAVLEALENVVEKINEENDKGQKNGDILTAFGITHLIETEVKPRYK